MKGNFKFKKVLTLVLAVMMLVGAMPINLIAVNYDVNHIGDKQINHKELGVKVVKTDNAVNYIANPAQPDIYTYRTDYKTRRGEKYIISYQPYVASVGANASEDEKKKVNKDILLPDLAGYDKAKLEDSFKIDYKTVVDEAKNAEAGNSKTGDAENGFRYEGREELLYKAKSNVIVVKHTFQSKDDFTKYTNTDGTITDSSGKYIDDYPDGKTKGTDGLKSEKLTKQWGNTGSTVIVSPLEEEERAGYVPEERTLSMQVPDDAKDFKLEYRYNLARYEIEYDTQGGTPLDNRTVYYSQEIPNLDTKSIPTKLGCIFKGWKPSHDIKDKDGKTYTKGAIINKADGNPSLDLDIGLIMPALRLGEDGKGKEKLTFTAVWQDKEKADYAVQFWVEKADHDENASLLEKYDYIGTHVYKQVVTGTRPDLSKEPIKDLPFPDLDKARLKKIWDGEKFYQDNYLLLNKFFVYNKELTDDINKDPKEPNKVKKVNANGKTVYNIYFDRQVYDLYFTKSNALSDSETFYPEIYKPDGKRGGKQVGGPGNLYTYKARFNQLMLKWPNDAMQTKGFTSGKQSYGWGPNYSVPAWPTHLDTPPYRLNADEFLDMKYNNISYESRGGYTKRIDKGDGTYIKLKPTDFTTLSFGIKQGENSIPHHMDLWMDGFKPDETIIRYDLYRTKADTDDTGYNHKAPQVQGFEAKNPAKLTKLSDENGLEDINDERDEITTIPDKEYWDIFGFKHKIGKLNFIQAFFSDADEYGDHLNGAESAFKKNGYLRFKYTRKKYPLRFNYDPSKTKDDNEFNNTNSLETFYEFPLTCLSPTVDTNDEYKKVGTDEKVKNLLDNPENLQKLGLTDLIYTDPKDSKLKVKRPANLSEQMVFKGWALDPAGKKMIWENPKETMPAHPVHLFAIWGEPDYKWKVTFDPDGGDLKTIKSSKLTTEEKKIKEGDIGQEEVKTYPKIGYENEPATDGKKQIFTVIQRQKLVEPLAPEKKGYDFMGWQVLRYKKDKKGDYTNELDEDSYTKKYGVPELYTFGNDVVSPLYLKAIWVPNQRTDIKVKHYFLDKDYNLAKTSRRLRRNPDTDTLEDKRAGLLAAAMGDRQDNEYILIPKEELPQKDEESGKYVGGKLHGDIKTEYEKYNDRVKQNNSFFQTFRVEPEMIPDPSNPSILIDNPNFKDNVFKFFYRPFRKREYTVNYVDERGKAEIEKFFKGLNLKNADAETSGITDKKEKEAKLLKINTDNKAAYEAKKADLEKILKKYAIVDAENVTNGNRHYDARNYRPIKGWKIVSPVQQQLFFDVNEDTNEFLGINGTGSDQVFFYYEDVRVIETKKDDPVPDGYVRLTFKVDDKYKGGVFKDKDDKEATELYYDVIKGLSSTDFPEPIVWEDGKTDAEGKPLEKAANRYYITPDDGKKFVKWDNIKWLNKDTKIIDNYTFTAYFDWAGAAANDMVITEAYKDPNGNWTNDFAPTIDQLKKQIVWKAMVKENGTEKIVDKPLPEGTKVEIVKDDETTLLTNDDVYELVKEANAADTDQTVRTVSVKAKLTFKDGKAPQVLTINIKIYKNVYEALNAKGDKPLFLKDAEKLEAKDGGLKDVTGDYVMVTVKPNKDFDARDTKVYYVNPKAWVEIPEVNTAGDTRFTKWKADIDAQNDNGAFDFNKRHKFTQDTVITPQGAEDVVEQKEGEPKPDVPGTYVKVIVDKTTNAELGVDEKQTQTFWVNPNVDVTIPVAEPKGKTDQEVDIPNLGKKKVNYIFKEWQKVKAGEADDSLADVNPVEKIELTSHKYTDKVTVIEAAYKKSIAIGKIEEPIKTGKLHTPEGKDITNDDLIKQITPQKGKEIESIEIVSKPDGNTVGSNTPAKVIVKYKDGTTQGTNDDPVVIPVEVHKNIVPADANGAKPKKALENYVKVILKAGKGGTFKDTLTNEFIYYVSPEVEVDMTDKANAIQKVAGTGYTSNGGTWTPEIKSEKITAEKTYTFGFVKSSDIVEKTDDTVQKPEGYVTVTFKTDGHGKVNNKDEIVYFVNPDAGIKIGKQATADNKTIAIPTVTANDGFAFTDKWQEPIDETNPIKNDRTHVAIFEAVVNKVTLTYEAGDGATGTVPDAVSVETGKKVALANADSLSKDNATFAGWKIDNKIYKVGEVVTLNENKTATAQWSAVMHTVRFDTKGGSDVEDKQVEHGKTLTAPSEPTLEGKIFTGWKEKGKENEAAYFDFNSAITEDKTLVAQWQDPVQEIGSNDTVEDQFIKVTFDKGAHGELYINDQKQASPLTYKVYKNYTMDKAKAKGLVVPKVIADTYYKLLSANEGWDKALELKGQDITFTAQYEPEADVIPVDPNKSDADVQREKPDGMVLVEFKVPEGKAFMLGDTKFYVTKDKVVDIKTPRVHKLELPNGAHNDYVFRGWDLTQLNNEWKFNSDTTLRDGAKVKPTISVRIPSANAKNVVITNMTEGATGYLRVTRGTADPVVIKSTKRGRRNIFSLATLDGGALNEGDLVEVYAKKDGVESDLREFIVSK